MYEKHTYSEKRIARYSTKHPKVPFSYDKKKNKK